jgi:phytoene synthase
VLLSRRDAVLDEARSTTRRVARTFGLACRLIPQPLRDDVYRLYLVFRTIDDLVDDRAAAAAERLDALEAWCRGGAVESREAAVLADLATRHPLPRVAFLDFCHGMRDDLAGRPIATEADLDRYCFRVAGTVGLVMAEVLGVRHEPGAPTPPARYVPAAGTALPAPGAAAAALGMAMQRTNILRDIDEDVANGRVYLATDTTERFGPPEPGRREGLMRDQIARADALYDEGVAGIPHLRNGRRAVAAAAGMYREILREIERDGYGRARGRVVVSRRRKLVVAARRSMAA